MGKKSKSKSSTAQVDSTSSLAIVIRAVLGASPGTPGFVVAVQAMAASSMCDWGCCAQIESGRLDSETSMPTSAQTDACASCSAALVATHLTKGLAFVESRSACAKVLSTLVHWDCDCVHFVEAGGLSLVFAGVDAGLGKSEYAEDKYADFAFATLSSLCRSGNSVVVAGLTSVGPATRGCPGVVSQLPKLLDSMRGLCGIGYAGATLKFFLGYAQGLKAMRGSRGMATSTGRLFGLVATALEANPSDQNGPMCLKELADIDDALNGWGGQQPLHAPFSVEAASVGLVRCLEACAADDVPFHETKCLVLLSCFTRLAVYSLPTRLTKGARRHLWQAGGTIFAKELSTPLLPLPPPPLSVSAVSPESGVAMLSMRVELRRCAVLILANLTSSGFASLLVESSASGGQPLVSENVVAGAAAALTDAEAGLCQALRSQDVVQSRQRSPAFVSIVDGSQQAWARAAEVLYNIASVVVPRDQQRGAKWLLRKGGCVALADFLIAQLTGKGARLRVTASELSDGVHPSAHLRRAVDMAASALVAFVRSAVVPPVGGAKVAEAYLRGEAAGALPVVALKASDVARIASSGLGDRCATLREELSKSGVSRAQEQAKLYLHPNLSRELFAAVSTLVALAESNDRETAREPGTATAAILAGTVGTAMAGCAVCGLKEGTAKLKTCSGCKVARYCSAEHQKQAWASHREECKALKAARVAERAAVSAHSQNQAAAAETRRVEVRCTIHGAGCSCSSKAPPPVVPDTPTPLASYGFEREEKEGRELSERGV